MDRGDSKQEEVSMLDGNHRAERNNRESAYGSNHDLKNASTAPPWICIYRNVRKMLQRSDNGLIYLYWLVGINNKKQIFVKNYFTVFEKRMTHKVVYANNPQWNRKATSRELRQIWAKESARQSPENPLSSRQWQTRFLCRKKKTQHQIECFLQGIVAAAYFIHQVPSSRWFYSFVKNIGLRLIHMGWQFIFDVVIVYRPME